MLMFGKRKKSKEKTYSLPIQIKPEDTELLDFFSKIDLQIPLSDKQVKTFHSLLKERIAELKKREQLFQEFQTTKKREKQLKETKEVVFSLRETDKTSGDALDFLKEKLTILQQEQEDLILLALDAKEKVANSSSEEELKTAIQKFLQSIALIDISNWEEDLDYYRTRFLMQKEQEKDLTLKEEFVPLEEKDQLSFPQEEAIPINLQTMMIDINKKQFIKLKSDVQEYNSLLTQQVKVQAIYAEDHTEEEFITRVKNQEQKSFEIGKELYTLKREQGILSLKTYEIIQTIRSRLLNITGAIAARGFLDETFNELKLVLDESLTFNEKREKLLKKITRIIRILRKEPAGNS